MPNVAVVDFSWLSHRYKNSLKELSCIKDGRQIPTGHVYGSLKFIGELSEKYSRIILCLDSHDCKRKALFSTYKSNRHKETGDWFVDYDIHKDTGNILTMLSNLKNVFYVEVPGYEADDLVAHFIRRSRGWDFYFRDNDILQTKGDYNLMVSFGQPLEVGYVVDRKKHIFEKYGIEKDWLPLLWKVVKGDPGDCIPIGLQRFPSKDLSAICGEFEDDRPSFESLVQCLLSHKYSGIWNEKIRQLCDKSSDDYKRLETNYFLVKPMDVEGVHLMQSSCGDIHKLFESYSIRLVDLFKRFL